MPNLDGAAGRQRRRDDAGWSWNTLEGHAGRDLTGFSHGVSGIAWALLELYAETGEAKFREGAERGFANERQWFNPEQGIVLYAGLLRAAVYASISTWIGLRRCNPRKERKRQTNHTDQTRSHIWTHGFSGVVHPD